MADPLPFSGYTKLVGQLLLTAADTNLDPDKFPDGVFPSGTIRLRPSVKTGVIKFPTAVPSVYPRDITLVLDNEGHITVNGSRDVYIPPTDDPAGQPKNWTWTAEFSVQDEGGNKLNIEPYSFSAPMDETINLFNVAPVSQGGGTLTIQGPGGEKGEDGADGTDGINGTARELAYAQTTTSFTTTPAGAYGITGGLVPGLACQVTGEGKPVTIEFFASAVWNGTTANGNVVLAIYIQNNGGLPADNGVNVNVQSPFTNLGPSHTVKRRMVLAQGVVYTFFASLYADANNINKAHVLGSTVYAPSYLSVEAR